MGKGGGTGIVKLGQKSTPPPKKIVRASENNPPPPKKKYIYIYISLDQKLMPPPPLKKKYSHAKISGLKKWFNDSSQQ